jgi:hypothetical protein
MPSKVTTPRLCPRCGREFFPYAHQVKGGRNPFCSISCSSSGKRRRPAHTLPVGPLEFSEDGATAYIPLRRRDGAILAYALIDADDAEWANQWTWRLAHGYAVRGEKPDGVSLTIFLHREILGLPRLTDGREGDHISRNTLDNRRGNLRIVQKNGQAQNQSARAGYSSPHRGVYWHKQQQKWAASVQCRPRIWLGYFDDEEEAARAVQETRLRVMPLATD